MYRNLQFTFKLAQNERTKLYIRHGHKRALNKTISEKEKKAFEWAQWVSKNLSQSRIKTATLVVMFFIAVPLMFASRANAAYFSGEDVGRKCNASTSTYGVFGWYLWVVPYMIFLRKFEYSDPFCVIWKLKVQTIATTVAAILLLITIQLDTSVTLIALLAVDIFWMLKMIFWWTESYIPVKLTRKKLKEGSRGTSSLKLSDTLASPRLIQMFEDHLLEEWAIENLEFYKEAVLYGMKCHTMLKQLSKFLRSAAHNGAKQQKIRLNIEKCTRKAIPLYERFINDGASLQINIPAKMANKIHEIFDLPEIDGIRASASSVPTFQEIQFVAPKNNHSRHVVTPASRSEFSMSEVTIQDGAGIRQISSPSQGLSTPNCRVIQQEEKLEGKKRRHKKAERFCEAVKRAAMAADEETKIDLPDLKEVELLYQIVQVFDLAKSEVYKLMERDSHRRFARKQEVKRLSVVNVSI
ncbi:hypothetical protein AAMO2058_000914000 [Amorphochlora amoebiformis]